MQFRKAHLALLLPILLIVGCQAAQEEPLSIPKGWDGNSIFWWQIGADTTGAYRPLETMDEMEERLKGALEHIDAERLIAAPDCGLGLLPRDIAVAKMTNLSAAAARV